MKAKSSAVDMREKADTWRPENRSSVNKVFLPSVDFFRKKIRSQMENTSKRLNQKFELSHRHGRTFRQNNEALNAE